MGLPRLFPAVAVLLLLFGCLSDGGNIGKNAAREYSAATGLATIVGADGSDLGVALMSEEMAVCSCKTYWCSAGCQPGWVYYDGVDAPEGGYMGALKSASSATATISLGQTLQPGTYYIFVKGIDYADDFPVTVSGGGATASAMLKGEDSSGNWTDKAQLTTISPMSSVTLTFSTSAPASNKQVLLKGVYITRNPSLTVTKTDDIIDLAIPTAMDNSPAVKGNVVENSSFEVGLGHGWGVTSGRKFPVSSIWNRAEGYHGGSSVKLPVYTSLVSKVYPLKPNKKYTVSAWVKTKSGSVSGSIGMANAYDIYSNSSKTYLSKSFTTTTQWQRVSSTGYLLKNPSSDYHIIISATGLLVPEPGTNANSLLIDGVQLEEGDTSDYSPKEVEVGLITGKVGNIYFDDEEISANLLAFSPSRSGAAKINFEIYDLMNRKVKEGSVNVQLSPGATASGTIGLSSGRRGPFRVVLWADGVDGSDEELVYSVVPRPKAIGSYESSMFGTHPQFLDWQLESAQRLGLRWARTLSPSQIFRWSLDEPSDNSFVWRDAEVARPSAYGLGVIGTIHTTALSQQPAWAYSNGLPDLDKFQDYVSKTVAHYKQWVKHWEIWNEPHEEGGRLTPEFYADMLKRASDAIESNDPNAKIIGMGGESYTYMQSVFASLDSKYPDWNWMKHIDIVSTHIYPSGLTSATYRPEKLKQEITDRYGVPVWNTESGDWDRTFYMGSNSSFVSWGGSVWPFNDAKRYYDSSLDATEKIIEAALLSLGHGMKMYVYYDARGETAPNYYKTHPTYTEYDDSIRPKGVAFSVAAYFIDNSTGLGNISQNSGVNAMLFKASDGVVVALWSKDRSPKRISLSGVSGLAAYDMMGNGLNFAGSLVVGRSPTYLVGKGVSVNDINAAFRSAAISVASDGLAPNVSIVDGPRGAAGNSPRFRWIAMDDFSLPALGNDPNYNPSALKYSYRLLGRSDAWTEWGTGILAGYSGLSPGAYTFEVRAKDDSGNISAPAQRQFYVSGAPPQENPVTPSANSPPSISIVSPANGSTYGSPASILITASASDSDGAVAQVQFYNGLTLISTDSVPPFSFSWAGVQAGNYVLTAKATDDDGASTVSSPVAAIVSSPAVNLPPVVNAGPDMNLTLPPGSIALAGASSDDGKPLGGSLGHYWSVASGPGNVKFSDANSLSTLASFPVPGQYVLSLAAYDGAISASDTATVLVLAAAGPKCPSLKQGISPDAINKYGCPMPVASGIDIKPDFNAVDLTELNSLELGVSGVGKISWNDVNVSLVKVVGSEYDRLIIDGDLNFLAGRVQMNPSNLPMLNRPATITLYNVSAVNPVIRKDGALCTECTIISNSGGILVFTVPGF